MPLPNPLTWRGTIPRTPYALLGLSLFALKFAIDWSLAHFIFKRTWSLIEYLAPGQAIGALLTDVPDRRFYIAMAAAALPFVAVGLSLTIRRLRDAGLSPALVILFFVPFANLLFFAALCLLPTSQPKLPLESIIESPPQPAIPLDYGQDPALFTRWHSTQWWPQSRAASAALAILLPVPVMIALILFGTHLLRDYGWGLFIGLPFVNGMLAAVLHGIRFPRTVGQCLGVAALSVTVTGVATFFFAIEGLGCLVMFLPLAWPVGLLGAALGYAIQERPVPPHLRGPATWRVGCFISMLLPLLMSAEHAADPPAPLLCVTTTVEINAPPETVWRHVVTFSDIPPPTEFLFKTGVAYPIRARIDGQGPGTIRYCEFSTGAFVEPIQTWDAPRLLKFAVTQNPPPMKEWTPWPNVHPPHLDQFLISESGQFKLTPLANNRTRLEGTTWYRHHMWPAAYWQLWSDHIIHQIHLRVLTHIKSLSEHP